MAYFDTTEYDFKDPRVYPPSSSDDLGAAAGTLYPTEAKKIGYSAEIDRFAPLSSAVNGGYAQLKLNPSTSETAKHYVLAAGSWSNFSISLSYSTELTDPIVFPGNSTRIYTGARAQTTDNQISLPSIANFRAADLTEGSLVLSVVCNGKSNFDVNNLSDWTIVIKSQASGQPTLSDYTVTADVTTSEGVDTLKIYITPTAEGDLATYLSTSSSTAAKIATLIITTEGSIEIPVTESYVKHDGATYYDQQVSLSLPEGYEAYCADLTVYSRSNTISYPDLKGFAVHEVPLSGPRIATAWTGGTFKKSDLPLFLPQFADKEGFTFI